MENNIEKSKLVLEYVKTFRKHVYLPLRLTGFCRFDIKDGKIVQLTSGRVIYNVLVMIFADCLVSYLLYSSVYKAKYLKIPDALCILHFALFANVMLLNITFLNRDSGSKIVEHFMDLDLFLGTKRTALLRKIGIRTFTAVNILIFITNIGVNIFLYHVYKVTLAIHAAGTFYFSWLFFSYHDYNFALMLPTFISLRTKYLNVALLKYGNIEEEYLPSLSLFDILIWNKKLNEHIKFTQQGNFVDFNKAFRMTLDLLDLLKIYRFPILCGVWTIVTGSFVAVQTFIMNIKNSESSDKEHTYVVVGWVLLSWGFMFLYATLSGMVQQQIAQTKLICSYILLKNDCQRETYKLMKSILQGIEVRNSQRSYSVYHLFYFDTRFILRIAASTVVYITVQLQLAFPMIPTSNAQSNETIILI